MVTTKVNRIRVRPMRSMTAMEESAAATTSGCSRSVESTDYVDAMLTFYKDSSNANEKPAGSSAKCNMQSPHKAEVVTAF